MDRGIRHLDCTRADYLVVVDAAPSAAADVIARAATLAPGKPIRYVVPTHHHDDHFPGVRRYAAAGATTVTTPGEPRLLQADRLGARYFAAVRRAALNAEGAR